MNAALGDLQQLSRQTWTALKEANNPPTLFNHAGRIARVTDGAGKEPVLELLSQADVLFELAERIWWYRKVKDSTIARRPPNDVARHMIADPHQPLPALDRLLRVPAFGPDGQLHERRGYEPDCRSYLTGPRLCMPPVPLSPRDDQVRKAIGLIRELLVDFPFVDDADIAATIALLLLPFVRSMIDGPTPLFLIRKPSPGTGATLLVDVVFTVSTGITPAVMTETRDEDEWRKQITAMLREVPEVIFIDNLRRRLDSVALSAVITSREWKGRLLGESQMLQLPVRAVWVATGNNPQLSNELARRTVSINLDAGIERPWKGRDFTHPDLLAWVSEQRSWLTWACLVLCRAWISADCPRGGPTLGGFDEATGVLGGILDVAGVPGFLDNLDQLYEESDAEHRQLRDLFAAWDAEFRQCDVTVKDLYPLAIDHLDLSGTNEQSRKTSLGKQLHLIQGRIIGGFAVAKGRKVQHARHWRLERRAQLLDKS